MAVLDLQLRRGDFRVGGSTSYEPDATGLFGALLGMAVNMRRDSGEPAAPLVGRLERPSVARVRTLVAEVLMECWRAEENLGPAWRQVIQRVDVAPGKVHSCKHQPADELAVVLDGRGKLHLEKDHYELEPGVVTLLPASSRRSFVAAEEPLKLLLCSFQ